MKRNLITVLNFKGGVGKSTIAYMLSASMVRTKTSELPILFSLDINGRQVLEAINSKNEEEHLAVVVSSPKEQEIAINYLLECKDTKVVDCAGAMIKGLDEIINHSKKIIVPLISEEMSVMGTIYDTLEVLINELKFPKEDIAIVFNKITPRHLNLKMNGELGKMMNEIDTAKYIINSKFNYDFNYFHFRDNAVFSNILSNDLDIAQIIYLNKNKNYTRANDYGAREELVNFTKFIGIELGV